MSAPTIDPPRDSDEALARLCAAVSATMTAEGTAPAVTVEKGVLTAVEWCVRWGFPSDVREVVARAFVAVSHGSAVEFPDVWCGGSREAVERGVRRYVEVYAACGTPNPWGEP